MVLPVYSRQLRGMRLKVDPLMPGSLFWKNAEEEVHNVYDIFIKKGNVIFDIGANIGSHSYYMARHFQNIAVFAFEPLPANAGYIKEMVSINKITNITLVEKAVGAQSGHSYFDASVNNHQGRITDKEEGLIVGMVSLDDYINEKNLLPDFIKIDVEGGEAAVLNGFSKNIQLLYPTIIVEVHTKEQAIMVAGFFRPLAYTLCKLIYLKDSVNNKPFILIDNAINGPEPPLNMNGQIVAIPNKRLAEYSDLVSGL